MEGSNLCMHLDTGGALCTSTRSPPPPCLRIHETIFSTDIAYRTLRPMPSPGFGQVLVRVEAVLLTADGIRPRGWRRTGSGDGGSKEGTEGESEAGKVVPGSDFCGIIIDIGPGETGGLRFHEKVVVESRSHCGT
eukprot:1121147-Rhodomonas_salina.1